MFKIKNAKGRLERVAFLRLIHVPLNYVFIKQAHRPKVCELFLYLNEKRKVVMFNYKKTFIIYGAIITSSLVNVCLASNDTILKIMEEGGQNNIQLQHQIPLQQELLQQVRPQITSTDIHEEARAHNPEKSYDRVIQLETKKITNDADCVYKTINQSIRYFSSFLMMKECITQVAASITSALIVYGIYKTFNT